MTDEDWASAWKIFQQAQALPMHQRSEALHSAALDSRLLDEVNALLELSGCCTMRSSSNAAFTGEQETPELAAGDEIRHYTILGGIGQGGFGRVYAARDRRLHRDVAIKVLHRQLAGSAEHALEEARAASALNHPNILTVYEAFEEGEQVAIVTELVGGGSLRHFLAKRQSPLPAAEALGIARQIAAALQEAHATGIIHRDIKPENVLLRSKDGLVKLVDFGLARGNSSSGLTGWGDPFTGTMRYLAPEQVAGQGVSAASDVFSMGLVFYELVTGVHPFWRESPIDSAVAIATADPSPPSRHVRSIPKQLDRLILEILAKAPAERPSASQVAQGLTAIQEVAHARGRRPILLAVVGALAVLLLVSLVRKWSDGPVSGETYTGSAVTSNDSTNPIAASAISPDGHSLVYADDAGLWHRSLDTGVVRPLPLPSALGVQHLAWNAESNALLINGYDAREKKNEVWRFDLRAQRARKLSSEGKGASFSPDARQVLFLNEDGADIEIAAADGTTKETFLRATERWRFASAIWSSDGARILYIQERPEQDAPAVFSRSVDTRLERQYLARNVSDRRLVASAAPFPFDSLCPMLDGRLLMLWPYHLPGANGGLGIWEARLDQYTSAVQGQPKLMISTENRFVASLSATADGGTVSGVVDGGQADVFITTERLVPIAGGKRLTFDLRNDFPDAWTPDSRAVIFESERSGMYHLYRQNLDSKVAEILTDRAGGQVNATVSPDGKWILFVQIESGNRTDLDRLFRIPLAGGIPTKVPLGHSLDEFRCPLTGKACVIRETIGHQLYRFSELDPIRGQGRVLAEVPWMPSIFGDWTLAADGSAVALPNHKENTPEILVAPLGSTAPRRTVKMKTKGQLWGIHAAAKQQGWYGEIRSGSKHHLDFIGGQGQVSILRECDYNTWAYQSPDGKKLAYVDYTLDRNVWVWRRGRQ